ncbi:hypothetical protein SETIT_3G253200v2 [Setaria italica]|uniref:Uncharacterized protein n=1 Tax=Setaria italica TaxID=4555 RepID=A0A368QIV2_SETIT|nr:hypothetical protein SETIT_3G253200v2 [Setaria italica]
MRRGWAWRTAVSGGHWAVHPRVLRLCCCLSPSSRSGSVPPLPGHRQYRGFPRAFSHAAPASLLFARGPGHASWWGPHVSGGVVARSVPPQVGWPFPHFVSIASCAYGGDWPHVTAAVVRVSFDPHVRLRGWVCLGNVLRFRGD